MSYVTVQGDMWDEISLKVYGDARFARELMRANPEHLDVPVFSDGVALTVPDVDTAQSADDLPPWKQVAG